jgi:hypothetical protein
MESFQAPHVHSEGPRTIGVHFPGCGSRKESEEQFTLSLNSGKGFSWPSGEPARLLDLNNLTISLKENDAYIWVEQSGLRLCLDLAKNSGEVQAPQPLNWSNISRYLFFHAYLRRNGLLLHAAGVVRQGYAYLFPGPSGSGKTTIVRLSPGCHILSDETTGVLLPANGGPPTAYGTPFSGEWGRLGEDVAAPVKALVFPQHASENKVTPLTPSEVFKRLLPCVFTYTAWQPRLQKIFDLAGSLAELAPGYLLQFRPEGEFWRELESL